MSIGSRYLKIEDLKKMELNKIKEKSLTAAKFNAVKTKCKNIVQDIFERDFKNILPELENDKYTFDYIIDLETTYFKKIGTKQLLFTSFNYLDTTLGLKCKYPFYVLVKNAEGQDKLKIIINYTIQGDFLDSFELYITGYCFQPLDTRIKPYDVIRSFIIKNNKQINDPISEKQLDMFAYYLNITMPCDTCKYKDPTGHDDPTDLFIRCADYKDKSCPDNEYILFEAKT